jgi:hypothetical protein
MSGQHQLLPNKISRSNGIVVLVPVDNIATSTKIAAVSHIFLQALQPKQNAEVVKTV